MRNIAGQNSTDDTQTEEFVRIKLDLIGEVCRMGPSAPHRVRLNKALKGELRAASNRAGRSWSGMYHTSVEAGVV